MTNDITVKQIIEDVSSLWFGGKEQGYIGLCLAGEVGELCNFLKKESRSPEFREDKSKEIAMEIPDIMFYLAQLIKARGLDFDAIWHAKMNHNERKYKRPIQFRPNVCGCEECFQARRIEGEMPDQYGETGGQ